MNKTKFTPAPWFAEQNSVWVDNDKLVCSCYRFNTKEADSNLIAAAPELYNLLNKTREILDAQLNFVEVTDNYKKEIVEEINLLLAKARGEL